MKPFDIIVAYAAANRGIASSKKYPGGGIPWNLPEDMKHFRHETTGSAVIMGRKTWELDLHYKPLPGRYNVVITSDPQSYASYAQPNLSIVSSFRQALIVASEYSKPRDSRGRPPKIFCIGGSQVYKEALKSEYLNEVIATEVFGKFDCDKFFPPLPTDIFERTGHERFIEGAKIVRYRRKHYENQYLDLVRRVLDEGKKKGNTLSVFGAQMRFPLDQYFPLLTTKWMFWKGIVEELLWFLRGSTDAYELSDRGVRIWNANGTRKFLDSRGLRTNREGDLGPVYGFQWRHWGSEYLGADADYTGAGIDQLSRLIEGIRREAREGPGKQARRHILTAWNVADLDKMALPPCHAFAQFYVSPCGRKLSCQLYQRSGDLGLGVPFNIASYSLLTHIIARECALEPGEFVHTLGDAHVYYDHIAPLRRQLLRKPLPGPQVYIRRGSLGSGTGDFMYKFDDFELLNYEHQGKIRMKLNVGQ